MNHLIVDGMKTEGKPYRNMAIVSFVLFALTFFYPLVNNTSWADKKVLIMFTAFLTYGLLSLYCWLYTVTYQVSFNESKISLKTLFRKTEINLCDIEQYSCARYKKSVFYQFHFFVNGKKILVNTRFKEELEAILTNHNTKQVSSSTVRE